jgi:hypothetical protein
MMLVRYESPLASFDSRSVGECSSSALQSPSSLPMLERYLRSFHMTAHSLLGILTAPHLFIRPCFVPIPRRRLLSTDEDLVDGDVDELDNVSNASHDSEAHGDGAANLEVLCGASEREVSLRRALRGVAGDLVLLPERVLWYTNMTCSPCSVPIHPAPGSEHKSRARVVARRRREREQVRRTLLVRLGAAGHEL